MVHDIDTDFFTIPEESVHTAIEEIIQIVNSKFFRSSKNPIEEDIEMIRMDGDLQDKVRDAFQETFNLILNDYRKKEDQKTVLFTQRVAAAAILENIMLDTLGIHWPMEIDTGIVDDQNYLKLALEYIWPKPFSVQYTKRVANFLKLVGPTLAPGTDYLTEFRSSLKTEAERLYFDRCVMHSGISH